MVGRPAVPQHLPDLRQRPAAGEDGRRGTVPQPVREDDAQSRPLGRGGDHLRDPASGHAAVRCFDPDEHAAVQGGWRPSAPQPVRDGLAGVGWQRELVPPVALAADGDLAVAPVDVLQGQRSDLPGSQPDPGQQRQDRVVAAPGRGLPVARREQCPDLRWLQAAGKPRVAVSNLGNCLVQAAAGQALQVAEPQQGAQRCRRPLRGLRCQPPGLGDDERGHVTGCRIRQLPGAGGGEPPHRIGVPSGDFRRQAALAGQPAGEPRQQFLRRGRRRDLGRRRGSPDPPQVIQQRRERLLRQVSGMAARPARRQERPGELVRQPRDAEAGGLHPAAQVRGQPQLEVRRNRRKPQPGQLRREPVPVHAQRAADLNSSHHCLPRSNRHRKHYSK